MALTNRTFLFSIVAAMSVSFGVPDTPALIQIKGTDKAKLPSGKMFFLGNYSDKFTLGETTDAIVYYGNLKNVKVRPEK